MKNLRFIIILICAFSGYWLPVSAQGTNAQTQSLANLLMELESHIVWEAVDSTWEGQRENWLSSLKNVVQDSKDMLWFNPIVSKGLLDLEKTLKYEALEQPKWNSKKAFWESQCKENERSTILLAKQLAILEQHILWTSVDAEWKTQREEWLKQLNVLINYIEPHANDGQTEDDPLNLLGK